MAIVKFRSDKSGGVVSSAHPDMLGFMDVSYAGAVLETRERNGHDDSDFYALVWDEATESVKSVEYATTRGWTYLNGATVDATPDVIAKADAYYYRLALEAAKDRAAAEARTPTKGKLVKVVKGRKVPKGTEGVVTWFGEGAYFGPVPRYRGGWSTKGALRVGLKTADGTVHYTAASNVVVTDPEEWLPSLDELESRANASVGRGRYLSAGAGGYAVLA